MKQTNQTLTKTGRTGASHDAESPVAAFRRSDLKEFMRPSRPGGLDGNDIEKVFSIIRDKSMSPDVRCKAMYVFEEKTQVKEAIKLFKGILHDESENRHVRHAADWVLREMGRNGKKPKKV